MIGIGQFAIQGPSNLKLLNNPILIVNIYDHATMILLVGLFTFSHDGNQNQQVGGCTFDVECSLL